MLETEARREVASTIVEQMGGMGRLQAMVKATKFGFGKNGELTFHFSGFTRSNICNVELNEADTYNIHFYKYNRRTFLTDHVKSFEGIYAEDLKATFEAYTGLYLSL